MKKLLLLLIVFTCVHTEAQWDESFSDGDFTNGIIWTGSVSSWQVVANSDVGSASSGSQTLRLSVAAGGGTAFLATQVTGPWGLEPTWSFWIGRRGQAATSSNISYIWLYSNEPAVSGTSVSGYRVRFGDDLTSGDKVVLEYVQNGTATAILNSSQAVPNGLTDYGFQVSVQRLSSALWVLQTSALPAASGGGLAANAPLQANILQGSVHHTGISQFDNGFVILAAQHTTGALARTGLELDQLRLSTTSAAPLPVRFSTVEGYSAPRENIIRWVNETESELFYYSLERSADGTGFTSIAKVEPQKNDGGRAAYTHTDTDPLSGDSYYRILATEVNGTKLYSSVIRLNRTNVKEFIRLYPNPVTNGELVWQAGNLRAGNYTVSIFSGSGSLRHRKTIWHAGGPYSSVLFLKEGPGVYFFVLEGENNCSIKFLIQ
jgi:hypothetical protein